MAHDDDIHPRQFLNRLSVLESEARKVIESQEKTLRAFSGLRADFQQWVEDYEKATAPRVASAGIVAAPVYTVNVDVER